MKNKIIFASLIVLGVTWVWGIHEPAANTRKSLTPLLNLNAQHDSNFYKTPTNEKSVWTNVVQPGFEAEIETARSHASIYYTLDAFFYSGLDEDLDFTGHTFKLDTGTRSQSDILHVNLRDTFRRTRSASELDYLNNSVSTGEFSINRFDPEILYQLSRSSIRLAYGNVWTDFHESGSGEDSVENRGTAEWKYNLDRANALGVNYQFWTVDYDGATSDYDSSQTRLVYSRLSKTLLLQAGAGWQTREFDMTGLSDIDGFVWDLMLQWQSSERTGLTFRVDNNLNNWSSGSDYFNGTKVAFTLNHAFVESLRGGLNASYQTSDYEFTTREDDTWNLEGSLAYTLTRWLTLSGAVGYENRDSNLTAADYDNVYGSARLNFVYPIGTGSPVISR